MRRWIVPILTVGLVIVLQYALEPLLGGGVPLLAFTLSVMISAWSGGFWSGIAAMLLGVIAGAFLFMKPRFSWGVSDPADLAWVAVFMVQSVFVSWICESLRRNRQRAETRRDELAAAEQRLLLTQAAARVASWELDAHTRTTRFSGDNAAVYGRKVTCFDEWWAGVHPDDRERMAAAIDGTIAAGGDISDEYRYVLPGGQVRWLASKGKAFRDEAGQVVRLRGVDLDITAAKRAQEALQEREAYFRQLIDLSPAMLWLTDVGGQATWVSRRWLEFTGRTLEQDAGTGWLESFHPADVEPVMAAFRTANEAHAPLSLICRVRRHDGVYRWVIDAGAPRFDDAGEFVGFIGCVVDIHDRKIAEDAHRASEESFRLLTEASPQIVWVVEAGGEVSYYNQRWYDYTGIARGNGCSDAVREVVHPGDAAAAAAAWERCRALGEPFEREIRYRRRDGAYRWHLVRLLPQRDAEGKASRWVGTAVDIEDQKMAQLTAESLAAELERKVQERTAQLTAANQELEAFSYSVSHDLRAPLRAIDGFSNVVLKNYGDRLDDVGRAYLERVRRGALRMADLIDDLLSLSRVTRSEMRRADVDLSEMARQVAEDLVHTGSGRDVRFEIEDGLHAEGDPVLLRAVLENLLGNAWKFTSLRPHATIHFGVADGSNGGEREFYVRDDGVGFDMRHARKLFGPFQRMHDASEFPGTGVGLATVQRIIKRHGGHVRADAAPGKGATFYFSL